MKRRFELDVLRIEELGPGPFTFSVLVNDVLLDPGTNDRVPLPRSGVLTVHICTEESTVGSVKLPLHLISYSSCCWLPLDFPEVLSELVEKVVGPRAMVSFTLIDLLSPVSEHDSERSFEDKLESPSISRMKIRQGFPEDGDLRHTLLELLNTVKAYADQKADLKRNIQRQDRELQAAKLALAQERAILQSKIPNCMDDRGLEIERLRLTITARDTEMKEAALKHEVVTAELEAERRTRLEQDRRTTVKIKELEDQLTDALKREKQANLAVSTLHHESAELREALGDSTIHIQELEAKLWRLEEAAKSMTLGQTDEQLQVLQRRLEESERQRASILDDMRQTQDFINKLPSQDGSNHEDHVKKLTSEVQRLTAELADAQEEVIRLQNYEDYSPLEGLSAQIAEYNQRATWESEALKKQSAAHRRSLLKADELQGMLTADLRGTQDLLLAKSRLLHCCQRENLNLRVQVESYQHSCRSYDDTERALMDFLGTHGYNATFSRLGEGLYLIGSKKLRLVLKDDKLLVQTTGGHICIEDYLKSERTSLKKCSSATSKSFSNRSSSAGLVTRHMENSFGPLLKGESRRESARSPSDEGCLEASNMQDIHEMNIDYEGVLLQSFTLDESQTFKHSSGLHPTYKGDITKPTQSSIGKRTERTPLKSYNVGSRTPMKPTKRLPFKM
jgi:predicted  nucleic acid-binding Zn-ribbon protein